nr:YdeI/OmpD-associated family protein [Oceanococcus sp. HetDA_MAG_MS8]
MAMVKSIEEYFDQGCGRCERFATDDCSTKKWNSGLGELRQMCLEVGLSETVKWGHPCYMHAGRNIVLIGAFREDFRLSFFNAGLLKDHDNILQRQGPNTQYPDMFRFTSSGQVTALGHVIRSYLSEAMGYAEKGLKAPNVEATVAWPTELTEALAADPELAAGFRKLTPGRQKSYLFNLNSAKKPQTRVARIAKFRDHILAGKGALER